MINHGVLSLQVLCTKLLLCCCAITMVGACSRATDANDSPHVVEVFKSIDSRHVLRLRQKGEAEWAEGGDNFVGQYTIEGNNIRVVLSVMGTTQAIYYERIEDGLKDRKGLVLYNEKNYPIAMAKIQSQRKQPSIKLAIGRGDERVTILAPSDGGKVSVPSFHLELRVVHVIPDFFLDAKTKTISSRSSEPNNPAVQIEVIDTETGKQSTRWLFMRNPAFSMSGGEHDVHMIFLEIL